MDRLSVSGKIVDLHSRRLFEGVVHVENGKIAKIKEEPVRESNYILPGFIDAHIHIESSILPPSEFARLAVLHGTVATISDPHEIANVLGIEGVRFMCESGKKVPFHFFFGASPCVPATTFETSGAILSAEDIATLFKEDQLPYLSEVMNFPGVLSQDPEIMKKIQIAKTQGKPIDGHAPGLRGENAKKYIAEGITTDHECITLDEALEKIQYGMKILIREGSAAKNFNALHPLIKTHPEQIMFCSDDKHPNDLILGHINQLVRRAIELGYDCMDVLRAACIHPNRHYRCGIGELKIGDPADFIVVDNLENFNVISTYIKGKLVASNGKSLIPRSHVEPINHFNGSLKKEDDFKIKASGSKINVIKIIPGELVTDKIVCEAKIVEDEYVSDEGEDILKLAVINRYKDAKPAIAFVKGMGLKEGAIASSIAHDSHNVIACGVDDRALCQAVNAVIASKGGLSVVSRKSVSHLPLKIAGLMSDQDGFDVAASYSSIKKKSQDLGSKLPDPFMALSFLALLVIPSLKLSDQGLFDADSFAFIPLSSDEP